ncbi:MAG: hypothetical protein GY845_04495 [Planctomycetes bacterium]|nr:hypothetical protein [Planctomycetota bacterium]
MCKQSIYLVLVLAFCLTSSVYAANIIWVSDFYDDDWDGITDDQAWVELLEAQGYMVDCTMGAGVGNGYWRILDGAKIAALNAADLIIISRNSNSGDYDDVDEIYKWNSITTPIISNSTHMTRSSRWRWFNTTNVPNLYNTVVDIMAPGSTIFTGVTGPVQITDGTVGPSTFVDISSVGVGNGTLLAKVRDLYMAWIVEWEAGVEFYPGSGQVTGGRRIFFAAGTQESSGIGRGEYNLTPEGEQVFLNTIRYLLNDSFHLMAYAPVPADGAYHGNSWVNLGWIRGFTSVSGNIYFGDNFDDVKNGVAGTFQGNQTATSFDVGLPGGLYPDGLVLDTTYYWRIDEVEADGTTVHRGDVWSFTVSMVEDFETNDFSKFSWSSYGEQSWEATRSERYSGVYSAGSGSIEDFESTTLEVSIDCVSGDITFYRKVSSEPRHDHLTFKIDGVEKGAWSGEEDWAEVSFPVDEGTRTFEWTYSKDGSDSEGDDAAWIDDIVFPVGL